MEQSSAVVFRRPDEGRGSCGGTTRLPPGNQWVSHQGLRQRLRELRRCWRRFEKLCARSDYAAATRERLLDLAAERPDGELYAMHLALVGQVASAEDFNPDTAVAADDQWVAALNKVLNEEEEKRTDG